MTRESFIELVRELGKRYPPSLEYREGDDFGMWQAQFRAAVERLRGPLPQ